ncbi:unnamed protein product [Spirodela intermedia]|uniref:Uncharacterized protein n=1 Tax=Spirodela intermedia TaxID=51605 RepID=A0A7I8IPZ4_SPIIN|nr:unnamed protein product [Spirodela intermedia]CAA6660009.1 unnamed protein product [Spirodela intermedia]
MKSPEEEDHLRLSLHLIASISEAVGKVRFFKGRWCAIAAKLDRLRAVLDDLSGPRTSPPTPLRGLPDLPVEDTCCRPVPLPAVPLRGSPRRQAPHAERHRRHRRRLDRHVADADILHKTGVLLEPPPPRAAEEDAVPQQGSWREMVRVEARNLITRLQIGAAASKNAALEELTGLLQEDDKNVLIAAAQGVVPALVRLLDSPCQQTREKAVAAISRVSSVESCRHVLVAEGVPLLNHLSRLLESGSSFAKEKSCVALQTLTLAKDNARAFGCRGGIFPLLGICQAGTPSSQAAAVGVLKNLAAVDEIRPAFAEENAVPVLLSLCSSGTAVAQENSIACLGICPPEMVETGRSSSSRKAGRVSRGGGVPAARGSGFGQRQRHHQDGSHEGDLRAVLRQQGGKEMGEVGCIPPLVRSLEAKSSEEKEAAARALVSLLTVSENRRIFKKEERGIPSAVQLLDPVLPNVDKKVTVELLASLSHSSKCRKRMVEAGACGFLQRLLEMEVDGAKKLLEVLGKGKIWGVLPRT